MLYVLICFLALLICFILRFVFVNNSKKKLEKEFCQQYESFNKEIVFDKLNRCYQIDKAFHLRVPTQIKHVVRRHGLPDDKWPQIYQDLICEKTDVTIKLSLAQTIKHSVKNKNANVELKKLIEILERNNDPEIQSEIVWTLGYQIKNFLGSDSKERIDENLVHEINSIIEKTKNELSVESVNFLDQQIQFQYYSNDRNHRNVIDKSFKISKTYSRRPIKLAVTKSQQTVRAKYKNNESEDAVDKLNSIISFKKKHRQVKVDSNTEIVPMVPDQDGSDLSFFSATYNCVARLYNRIKTGRPLKKSDKDKYLASKFLGLKKKWLLNYRIDALFVDRMIVEIFFEVSKKQLMTDEIISLLMKCIDSLDKLEERIFGVFNAKEDVASNIVSLNKRRNTKVLSRFMKNPLEAYKDGPQIILDIARKIFDQQSTDAEKIMEIISSEIKQIRLKAILALHNCAMRNNEIFDAERLEHVQELLRSDHDNEFNNCINNLLTDIADNDTIDPRTILDNRLVHLEHIDKDDDSIDYIYQQSKNERRFQQLFDNDSIDRIISLLEKPVLAERTKKIICCIINNYLERSESKSLNHDHFQVYFKLIKDPKYSEDLKIEALKSMVFSAEKTRELPDSIVASLVESLYQVSENIDNYIILVLKFISEQQVIKQVDNLSKKLLCDLRVVEDGIDIVFEKKSAYNHDCQSISSIVAMIFFNCLERNVKISSHSVEYLIEALNSSDKQTRILSAKVLHIATENTEIDDESLIKLKEHVDSQIYSVAVYSTVAYSRGLVKLSAAGKSNLAHHIQFLPKIYVYNEDLRSNEENFTGIVNKNILIVLSNEAEKKQFDDDIFRIFDHILLFETDYQIEAVEILRKHSKNKYYIPKDTISTLENLVNKTEFSQQALKILENLIYNKQIVSEKILHFISNDLYLSEDNHLRQRSFELLSQADYNQDTSDEIFDILELERASVSVMKSLPDANDAILYMCKKTKEGQKLTLNCFRALSYVVDKSSISNEILEILLNISNCGHIIPDDLIKKLVENFHPKQKQMYFIEIFENLVKNNQNLPKNLLLKLELALENGGNVNQILSIFVLIGQRGEKLSRGNTLKILDQFWSVKDPLIIQKYLSFICSVIESEAYSQDDSRNHPNQECSHRVVDSNFLSYFQVALRHALEMNNQEIIRKSIAGFQTLALVYHVELSEESVETLLHLATKDIGDKSINQQIHMILNRSRLDKNQKSTIELCYLTYESDDQLLNKLSDFVRPKLLEKNFHKINCIIDHRSDLHCKALEILLKCSNKEDIPDKLVDSITILFTSTNSREVKILCCELIIQTGKFNQEILSSIIDQDESIINSVLENPVIPKEFRDRINSFLQKTDSTNIRAFLNEIYQQLQKGIQLSDTLIEKVFSIKIKRDIEQSLVDIYSLILIQNPNYSLRESIVDILEKLILSEKITYNILNAYKEIIKITKCQTKNFENVFNCFVENLIKNSKYARFHVDILICIALASEAGNISNLKPLEINLFHDDEIIRHWSFRGLKAAYERDLKSIKLEEWCNHITDELEKRIATKINFDLELFETLAIARYINFHQIRNKSQDRWIRELLINDISKRFNMSKQESFHMYANWLEIEEEKIFSKDQSDILLKLLHRTLIYNKIPSQQCFQIIRILKNIDFENAANILSNSQNPFKDFHKIYLVSIIKQRLENKKDTSDKYVDILASNMIEKFDLNLNEKLLNAIKHLDNLRNFEEILNFAFENQIKISDIYVKDTTILVLKRSLEIKFLGNQIKKANRLRLGIYIDSLLDFNWTFQQLNTMLNTCKLSKSRKNERYFVDILRILVEYKLTPTPENERKILSALEKPIESWLNEINIIVVECTFSEIGQVKSTTELLGEFKSSNSSNANVTKLVDGNLLSLIESIRSSDLTSHLLKRDSYDWLKCINTWNSDEIRQWATEVKTKVKSDGPAWTYEENFLVEACSVIKQAIYLDTGYYLTDAQILSCLVLLHTEIDKGRLLQVETGEGKSTIISVLAVIYALRGNNVDIITSSPVLAERDSIEKSKFYNMFELECSHNNDKSIYLTGPKACYKKQIVYGEVSQFQFDTLRTEYAQLNSLAGRQCQVAIVDEVDSMLIDDSSKIARLATFIPGMDQLQIIYHFIWYRLNFIYDNIVTIDNNDYLLCGKRGFDGDKMFLEIADEKGDIIRIPDLKNYISSGRDISHIGKLISDNDQTDVFIKNQVEVYIRGLIGKDIRILRCFQGFVDNQIPKWIDSAITAFHYQNRIHYIVQEGLIKPVDFSSTGIVQSSSNWSDGLHQFLQIKHNLKMTSETLTTNFLSNKGYFTRYGSNLFGLTGTLGSDKAKEVLSYVYRVDLAIIPSLRKKQYLPLPSIVAINKNDWLNEICHSAINESNKGRGTLIICETIEHSEVIAEKIRQEYRSSSIKLYTMNNMNQEKNVEIVHSGEIIIATNLAGRGTDIKTHEIEQYGGLHVIVTFMPPNKRVEDQAFGRTARQGKRGTGQKMLNAEDLIHYESFNIEKISEVRDDMESNMLSEFIEKDLEMISLKDKLFVQFCTLLNRVRNDIREKTGYFTQATNKIKSVFKNCTPSVFESNLLMSIEEKWAMFLREIDNLKFPINKDKVFDQYERFSKKIFDDYVNDRIIKNPYYHINIANDLIINDSSVNSKYDQAMKHFNQATELDPDHCAAAFVGKGWLLLKGREAFFRSKQQESGYKEAAVQSFLKALQILSEETGSIISIQILLQQRFSKTDTALSKQLIQKANILGNYCNNIENLLNVVRKSQRLIQTIEIFKPSSRTGTIEDSGVLEIIKLYDGIEKGIEKWCDIRLISEECVNDHIADINDMKEIGLFRTNENQVKVIYKQKNDAELAEWEVDDEKLKNYLLRLNYDEKILDRNNYSHIYKSVYQKIKSKNSCISTDFLVASNDRKYQITFNDLTIRKDTITKDQAIDTINYIIVDDDQHSILDRSYTDINISINQIKANDLKTFLSPNIEIKELTKEQAISQLKDKSSYFRRCILPKFLSPDSRSIDLEIILDKDESIRQLNLQAICAIDIIEEYTNSNAHFNLTFKSVNPIAEVLKNNVLSKSRQNLEFIGLNAEETKKKITKTTSSTIDLEISDVKDQLIEIIYLLNETSIELVPDENEEHNDIRQVVNKAAAEKIIRNKTINRLTIKLLDLNKTIVEAIVSKCPKAEFNINFISITEPSSIPNELEDELVSIHFEKLTKRVAKVLIEQIRKQNFDFSLTFKNLTNHQARSIIEKTPIESENIEINKFKCLSELFMNNCRPDLELSEFSARGIEYLLEISEKNFIPWISINTVIAIAAVQMAVGAALISTGFGVTIGLALITEGGADLFTAYRAYSKRQFSWKDYGKQKAVSLVISAISVGISGIKDAGKGLQNVVSGVGEEVLEQAGTKVVTDGKSIGQVLIQTGKNLKSLAIKQIGVTIGQNALKEGLNKIADISSNFLLEQMNSQISASIQNRVIDKFSEPKLWKIVTKMYAIDSFRDHDFFKKEVNNIVTDIINPNNDFMRNQWDSIGGPLCDGILSSVKQLRSPASISIRILGTLNGMSQITSIIDTVHEQLFAKLSQINQETLSMVNMLHRYCQVEREDAYRIMSILQKQSAQDVDTELNYVDFLNKIAETDLNELNQYKDKILTFLTSLDRCMSNIESQDFSETLKFIADAITEHVCRIVQSQLVSPWSSYAMGELTKVISERTQHYLIVDKNENSDSQNRENQEKDESEYNTIEKQIHYNTRDYTIAYSQCEIIHYSQQKDTSNHGITDEQTKEYIDHVRRDQPANISDMIGLAEENNLEIKLVDDPNYQLTEEDKAKGTRIVVYSNEQMNNQETNCTGHFRLMSSGGTLIDIPSESNDSGYAVIQQILRDRNIDKSISIGDLRNQLAQRITNNPRQFHRILESQRWIEVHYPREANNLLMRRSAKDETIRKLSISDGIRNKDIGTILRIILIGADAATGGHIAIGTRDIIVTCAKKSMTWVKKARKNISDRMNNILKLIWEYRSYIIPILKFSWKYRSYIIPILKFFWKYHSYISATWRFIKECGLYAIGFTEIISNFIYDFISDYILDYIYK